MKIDEALEVLGLTQKNVSEAQIKKAYHKLALKYHPDHNPNDPEAGAKFSKVNEAYKFLYEQETRAVEGFGYPQPTQEQYAYNHGTKPRYFSRSQSLLFNLLRLMFAELTPEVRLLTLIIQTINPTRISIPAAIQCAIFHICTLNCSLKQKLSLLCIEKLYFLCFTKNDWISDPVAFYILKEHIKSYSNATYVTFEIGQDILEYFHLIDSITLSWDQNLANLLMCCYRLDISRPRYWDKNEKPLYYIKQHVNKFYQDHPIASKALATVCVSFIGLVLYKQYSSPHISELQSFSEAAIDVYSAADDLSQRASQSVSV